MPDSKPFTSTSGLKDFFLQHEGELEAMVGSELDLLVAKINSHQEQLRQACLGYRAAIPEQPTDVEFYDFIDFLREMTRDFHVPRIDANLFNSARLRDWRERCNVPTQTTRRSIMLTLLDDTMEKAILSGVEVLREMLRNHQGSAFPISWYLGPQH